MAKMDYGKANRRQSVSKQGWIDGRKPSKPKTKRKPRVFLTKAQRTTAEKLYHSLVEHKGVSQERAFSIVLDSLSQHQDNERRSTKSSKSKGKDCRSNRR